MKQFMSENTNEIQKIVAAEQNLRVLINNTDDPIWLVDVNCVIIECNQSFKKWVNYFIGQELDKGDNVLFEGKNKIYLEKFEMCYRLALSGSAFRSVEDMNIEDSLRYTTVSFNPVFGPDNKVTGVSCFARDITEQRKHLFKIEEQNEALREIAFIESHNLRGPVATIMGLQQLFNYNDLTDPINREILDGIARTSDELDKIIREVVKKSNAVGL